MRGLEWGQLYEKYHSKAYNPAKVSTEVKNSTLIHMSKAKRESLSTSLVVQQMHEITGNTVFDDATKNFVYASQTKSRSEK